MKKITKLVTFYVIPALVVAILIYDVFAIKEGGTEASISSLVITYAYKFPFMPFSVGLFLGLLGGHLFWRMRPNEDTKDIDKLH